MGQGTSAPGEYGPVRDYYPPGQSPEEKRAKALRAWRDVLRTAGKGCQPANYRDLKFEDVHASDALRSLLAALGASAPSCVYCKLVSKVQLGNLTHDGRLSVGPGRRGRHITEAFTDGELDRLIDDSYGGLEMPVFDRDGRRYHFKCLYAEDTEFYRLVGGAEHERFMADNNVVRDVEELGKEIFMEMFVFRSPALRPKGMYFDDHPDGALGMIILFLDLNDDAVVFGDELLDDDSLKINQMMKHYPKVPEGYTLE